MPADQGKRGTDRRKGDRRVADDDNYDGHERRKGDRRSGGDRRSPG